MVTDSAGVAVLGEGLEGREFPPGEHPLLCNRIMSSWDRVALYTRFHNLTRCWMFSFPCAVPELTEVWTESMYIKAQLKRIKIPSKVQVCPVTSDTITGF